MRIGKCLCATLMEPIGDRQAAEGKAAECKRSTWFATTHWSVVLSAGQSLPGSMEAREALCRTYWEPLYLYIRRLGSTPQDAEDLTQAFLARLLEKDPFAELDSRNGKFRSFLLISLRNFLADDRDRAAALKRGGGHELLSLDYEAAESRLREAAASELPPGRLYDRQWALTVFDRALRMVGDDYARTNRLQMYEAVRTFISKEGKADDYASIGDRLGMTPAAVRMAALRLRQRFRDQVRQMVATTVSDESEVEDEMRYLVELLSQ